MRETELMFLTIQQKPSAAGRLFSKSEGATMAAVIIRGSALRLHSGQAHPLALSDQPHDNKVVVTKVSERDK